METFRIKAVSRDGTCTLALTGEVDLAVADDIIELRLVGLSEAAVHTLVVDLAAVTFIDSTAVGAFMRLSNAAQDATKRFVLTNVPDRVLRVLEITGLTTVFTIADTQLHL